MAENGTVKKEIFHRYYNDPEFHAEIHKKVLTDLEDFRLALIHRAPEILRDLKLFGKVTIKLHGSNVELIDD